MTLYTQVSANRFKTGVYLVIYMALVVAIGWLISQYYGSSGILFIAGIVALVQGGIFRAEIDKTKSASHSSESRKRLNPIGYSLTYGFVFTLRKISVAFTQRDLYAMIKEQTRHEVGNISIHIAL